VKKLLMIALVVVVMAGCCTTSGSTVSNKPVVSKKQDKPTIPDKPTVPEKQNAPTITTYRVTVNYALTLEQMIQAGKYDAINPDITESNFPVNVRDNGEVKVHLVPFDCIMKTDDVLVELNKQGLRPAELPELLALGAQYPELQRRFPIVALGSVWQDPDRIRDVPCLYGRSSRRNLVLIHFHCGWGGSCCLLAVRK